MVGWLEFNVPFQHKYGYIRDDKLAYNVIVATRHFLGRITLPRT